MRCWIFYTLLALPLVAQTSWFPLEVGNEWIYFRRDRAQTGRYVTWRFVEKGESGGSTWYRLDDGSGVEQYFRQDGEGRVWRWTEQFEQQLFLDPTVARNQDALKPVSAGGPLEAPVGSWPESLVYSGAPVSGNLIVESGRLAPGIGFVEIEQALVAGSSGGFFAGYSLVYARIGRRTVLALPEISLSIAAEAPELTLRPGSVTNCAVPCYFVACRLVPGADPPDTFKPCMRVRASVQLPAPGEVSLPPVEISLTREGGGVAHEVEMPLALETGRADIFFQVPLYSAPNLPLPGGTYRLRARIRHPDGEWLTSVPVRLRE